MITIQQNSIQLKTVNVQLTSYSGRLH